MNILEYSDRDMLVRDLATTLSDALQATLKAQSTATFVVPGGTTPGPVFDLLSRTELNWGRVRVLLSDERWVPDTHDRSNAKLLKQRLFQHAANAAQFVPFYREDHSPETAAPVLSEELRSDMPISVLLLGMGADMHTASLFPGAAGLGDMLDAAAPLLVPVSVAGQEPRISFSGPALCAAQAKHLVIFGADKREALQKAAHLPTIEAPVKAVMEDLTVHWAE